MFIDLSGKVAGRTRLLYEPEVDPAVGGKNAGGEQRFPLQSLHATHALQRSWAHSAHGDAKIEPRLARLVEAFLDFFL
jgi:hypothetical protein